MPATPLPSSPDGFDALIMLGGAQDALDDANHPYLKDEAALARAFGEADKAVLGICLGAQILARGYGAGNILGRPLEFGWHEVRATEAGRADPVLAAMGEAAPIFHWHLDTFTLPPGAVHLATSAMTADAGLPHRPRRLRHPVPFRGRHRARRELDARFRRRDRRTTRPTGSSAIREEAARHGAAADAAGLALARAWIARAAEPSPSGAEPG